MGLLYFEPRGGLASIHGLETELIFLICIHIYFVDCKSFAFKLLCELERIYSYH